MRLTLPLPTTPDAKVAARDRGLDAADLLRQELTAFEADVKAVRRVRTIQGARRFGQPIGSVIVPDLVRLSRVADVRPGELVEDPAQPGNVLKVQRVETHPGVWREPVGGRPMPGHHNVFVEGESRPRRLLEGSRLRVVAYSDGDDDGGPRPPDPPMASSPTRAYGTLPARLEAKGDGKTPMPAGTFAEGDPRNDPDYLAYLRGVDETMERALAAGLDTYTANTVEVKPGVRVWTAERAELHDEILDRIMHEHRDVPRKKHAVMMGGLPGAGKSTFLVNHGGRLGLDIERDANGNFVRVRNAIVINPDDMKSLLFNDPELVPPVEGLKPGEMASLVHEESSYLANALAARALAKGYNVVFDITLGDGRKAQRKYLTNPSGTGAADRGYQVDAAFVDGDMATSLHRAGLRHKRPDRETGNRGYSGRYVPYDHIATQGVRSTDALTSDGQLARSQNRLEYDLLVREGVFDRAIRYDNVTGEFTTDAERFELSDMGGTLG